MNEGLPFMPDHEGDKHFIKNYQFVGYLGNEYHGKVVKAIEIGTNSNVAIRFIPNKRTREKRQVLIQYLLEHDAFVKIMYSRPLKNMHAYVSEHHVWPTLADFVESTGPLSLTSVCQIMKQGLEAIAYLHSFNISHNKIGPRSILISARQSIIFNDLSAAEFYDRSPEKNQETPDAIALGRLIIYMLTHGKYTYSTNITTIRAMLNKTPCSEADLLLQALEYIFAKDKSPGIPVLCAIFDVVVPAHLDIRHDIMFLDVLVVDILKDFGVAKAALAAHLNNPACKEYHIYRMCKRRIEEELKQADECIKSPVDTESSYVMLWNAVEQRKELLNRRLALYMCQLEATGSLFCNVFCNAEPVDQVTINMLVALNRNFKFGMRKKFQLQEVNQRAISIVSDSAELELNVVGEFANDGCGLKSADNGKIIFRRCSGEQEDFVLLIITILDEIILANGMRDCDHHGGG